MPKINKLIKILPVYKKIALIHFFNAQYIFQIIFTYFFIFDFIWNTFAWSSDYLSYHYLHYFIKFNKFSFRYIISQNFHFVSFL